MVRKITCILTLYTFCQTIAGVTKCDYDAKIESLELEIDQLAQQLSSAKEFYENEIQALKAELKRRGENAQEPNVASKNKKRQLSFDQVAFYAQLSKDIPRLGNNQIILYDIVTTNIGSAYNKVDGIFRAPTAGVYVFNWATTNRDHSYMNTEVVVNGQVKGKAMSDAMDHADYAVATNVAVLSLSRNDEVWIRTGTWHNGHVAGDSYTTFSGYRIYFTEQPDIVG